MMNTVKTEKTKRVILNPEAELRAKRMHARLRARFHWARDVYFHLNRHGIRQPVFLEDENDISLRSYVLNRYRTHDL